MRLRITTGDKVLSMINSGLSICVILFTKIFNPENINNAFIIAFVLIAITIFYLAIKVATQSVKIHNQEKAILNLEEERRAIEDELAEKENRIKLLEQSLDVPFFKKWHLFYTFIWRKAISFLNNPVDLNEVHVVRRLVGDGEIKDNNVSYEFNGTCVKEIDSFKFCLGGIGSIPLDSINFVVKDMIKKRRLEFEVLKNTRDSNIKYIEIFFGNHLKIGESFKIKISWQWPNTAYDKSDYFSIPNIYSLSTKLLILDLYPTSDMNLKGVETYKFGVGDSEPERVDYVYSDKGLFRSIIQNPEMNADYITYYG